MVEASWQPDPDDGARLRWWDGTRWTEHVAPGPEGQEVGAAPMRTTAGPPVSPGLAPASADDEEPDATVDDALFTGAGAGAATPQHDDAAAGAGAQPRDAAPTDEQAAPASTDEPTSDQDREAQPPVWTAASSAASPTEQTEAGSRTGGPDATAEHRAEAERPPRRSTQDADAAGGRTSTPSTGGGPNWNVGRASGADDRSKRPFITARAVHRIIAAIGAVMLLVASVQMILLRSVSGDSVAEAFYNAVGWGLLGATIWGLGVYSMREIDAERAAARERAQTGDPHRDPTA